MTYASSSTRFKKGDEIECISSTGRLGVGEKFIVVDSRPQLSAPSFHPELVYIEVDGVVRNYSPKHFELVKEETRTYKEILEDVFSKYDKHKSFAQQISETEGGNDVSRSDVVNVKEPPKKSEWFGYKYRVTPETSRLLQEAVFKDGGGWRNSKEVKYTNMKHIFVKDSGDMTFSNDEYHFVTHTLLSKIPPQVEIPQPETKKEFKHGYWYKLKDQTYGLDVGKYYRIKEIDLHSSCVRVYIGDSYSNAIHETRFDVNSESSLYPLVDLQNANNTCVGFERDSHIKWNFKTLDNVSKQTEEKQTMRNANRRVVNVKLLDNDSGLPVEYALVAQFQGIVTEDSDEVVKQEILLNKNIADAIAEHNKKRVEQTDLEILKRTGNDVKLRQVKLKDLTWIVSVA